MKKIEYIKLLLGIPMFSGFSEEDLVNLLIDELLIRDFSKDEIIYLQNEKANSMDIILEGIVNIQSIDENGNILSIIDLEVGDMLGGNLIFSNKNEYPMTILSKTNVKILSMSKEKILELCQINKVFLKRFLETLSDKALVLTTKIHSLAMKTIREKVMDYLIFESNRQNSKTIRLEISKKELAERFGVERPSLQRELRKMKDEGLINYDSTSIRLI